MRQLPVLAALCAALVAVPSAASAATFTVNSTGNGTDPAPGNGICGGFGICTLRAAIQEANALAGRDRIVLGATTYQPTTELPAITKAADLVGAGARSTTLSGASAAGKPVLTVSAAGSVTISDLTVTGATGGEGAGIDQTAGVLTLDRVAVVDNERTSTSLVLGAGIRVVDGALTVRDSLVADNHARVTPPGDNDAYGAGVYAGANSELTLSNVTVTQNSATANENGGLTSQAAGGGILASADALLEHVTVAGNSVGGNGNRYGGNVAASNATVTLRQSIVADGSGPPLATQLNCVELGVAAAFDPEGMNLESANSCGLPAGQLRSTSAQLGPLTGGGPTDARVPAAGSAAVGAATACLVAADQRGLPRPLGGGCELGAAERAADLAVTVTPSAGQVTAGGEVLFTVVVRNTGPEAAAAPVLTLAPTAGLGAGAPTPAAGGACAGVQCTLDPLGPGSQAVVLVTARPAAAGAEGLTATATTSTGDPDSADATATAGLTVLGLAPAAPLAPAPGQETRSPAAPRCATTRRGTRRANRLTGGPASDRILGGAGNDRIDGRGGPDCLFGQAGRDRLVGGTGGDELSGGAGNDTLLPGAGADTVSGGGGADRIHARDGARDRITCGAGRDRVFADRRDVVAKNCERVSRR